MQLLENSFIARCAKGNRTAQKQLFEHLYAPMFRVCMRYLNHKEDAEDCLMKGFLKVFQHLPRFSYENENGFLGWVRRIMANECLMFLRQKNRFLLFPEEEPLQGQFPAEALLKMEAEELNSLIMQLPLGYRTVFNLFAIEGFSHKEISALLQISENTSKTQFSKAKARLKSMLEQKKPLVYGKLGE
ncbi:MAG TPA: sigma-70 family RNA polymerase sigma factor [Flavisolibacter sp.]|nr:sigma-70 family RNA polymerase sigma factor [Flavisolibacter sp.]